MSDVQTVPDRRPAADVVSLDPDRNVPGRSAPGFGAVLRAEWIKFWTVRSTRWSLVLLLTCFAMQAVRDLSSVRNGLLPRWFGRLRLAISVIVIASIGLVLLA